MCNPDIPLSTFHGWYIKCGWWYSCYTYIHTTYCTLTDNHVQSRCTLLVFARFKNLWYWFYTWFLQIEINSVKKLICLTHIILVLKRYKNKHLYIGVILHTWQEDVINYYDVDQPLTNKPWKNIKRTDSLSLGNKTTWLQQPASKLPLLILQC